jgi:urease accessory protein
MDHHAALLLLADGRLPAGAYAHSGGLEPAVVAGRVRDLDDVSGFVAGRLETVGVVAATFAAAACHAAYRMDRARLGALDAGLDARMPSPASRGTSRQLGRQLRRVATTLRDDQRLGLLGREPHQPLALGVVATVFDLVPKDAALAVLYETAAGVVTAAVRLLALDPLAAHAVVADLAERLDQLADQCAARREEEVDALPAGGAPLLDLGAERHAQRSGRLFAS